MYLTNLFEDQGITLYRGDKEQYDYFTGSNSIGLLYGQQLYLTTEYNVAKEFGNWITEFNFDRSYISRIINADLPMDQSLINTIAEHYPNGGDFRYINNGGEEKMHLNFKEWCELFKDHKSRYAWSDPSRYYGGEGNYPSFDMVYNGAHGGSVLQYPKPNQKTIWESLSAAGYTGLTYLGGVNQSTGALPRGGGSSRHHVYAFWDFDYCNNHIVGQKQVL